MNIFVRSEKRKKTQICRDGCSKWKMPGSDVCVAAVMTPQLTVF